VGVALLGQVEGGIGGVQVRRSPMAIGQALDGHGAEHGGELAVVAGLDAAVGDAVGVDDLDALLPGGAQVQVVLEEPAQQLPTPAVEIVLQLGVGQRAGLGALQPADDVLQARPGPAERRGVGGSGPVAGDRRGARSGPGCDHRDRRRSAARARRSATPASAAASSSARAAL
jgi:hypothetical protein